MKITDLIETGVNVWIAMGFVLYLIERWAVVTRRKLRQHNRRINMMYRIKYRHDDCPKQPGVEWEDIWSCACNGECPACGTKDIEPVDWDELNEQTANRA